MEEANGEDGSHVHAADAFPPSLTLTPLRHTKAGCRGALEAREADASGMSAPAPSQVLHFVRHGEGFHNVVGLADEAEYLNPRWTDAHLTPLGWQVPLRSARGLAGERAPPLQVTRRQMPASRLRPSNMPSLPAVRSKRPRCGGTSRGCRSGERSV